MLSEIGFSSKEIDEAKATIINGVATIAHETIPKSTLHKASSIIAPATPIPAFIRAVIYMPKDKSKPTEMVNFILTAKNPAGPWSDPYVIEGAPGIDPDIFFDDNGKVWFVGTHDTGNPNKNGIGEIWIQELDLNSWKLIGDRFSIWTGACGGCCVEGPHIYKENNRYYLMVAEGGTSYNHAVMIASSENIEGPYDSNPKNPILTSRHLSNNN